MLITPRILLPSARNSAQTQLCAALTARPRAKRAPSVDEWRPSITTGVPLTLTRLRASGMQMPTQFPWRRRAHRLWTQ